METPRTHTDRKRRHVLIRQSDNLRLRRAVFGTLVNDDFHLVDKVRKSLSIPTGTLQCNEILLQAFS